MVLLRVQFTSNPSQHCWHPGIVPQGTTQVSLGMVQVSAFLEVTFFSLDLSQYTIQQKPQIHLVPLQLRAPGLQANTLPSLYVLSVFVNN